MSERQWRIGWEDGYDAMCKKLDGFSYMVPGIDKSDDYLEGFCCGMEYAFWWHEGWDDGCDGQRVRRCVPEAFVDAYWHGYRSARNGRS
ncbi:hypothetical protein EDC61_11938 [Sulfuritortus calidifontis]|uniref:Uncharacterized protein n=1 Tax=Sulfuritortus calidifontis TaxID=1914471 RepID=A0A4V2UQB5_9PROT|nr:hypothetical protein [Sulfuritortus calidifontis]TCS69738.1 hypothetical protein EDC61_11938 [Sulfuritortus calidifontis]